MLKQRSLNSLSLLLLGIMVVAVVGGCRRDAHPVQWEQWQLVQSTQGYQLALPPNWSYRHPGREHDLDARSADTMTSFLGVSVKTLDKAMSYDEYEELIERNMKNSPSLTCSAPEVFTGKMIGRKRVQTVCVNDIQVRYGLYDFLHGRTVYTLTIITTPQNFVEMEPVYDAIARSFMLKR